MATKQHYGLIVTRKTSDGYDAGGAHCIRVIGRNDVHEALAIHNLDIGAATEVDPTRA